MKVVYSAFTSNGLQRLESRAIQTRYPTGLLESFPINQNVGIIPFPCKQTVMIYYHYFPNSVALDRTYDEGAPSLRPGFTNAGEL